MRLVVQRFPRHKVAGLHWSAFGAEKDACCCLDPVVKFSALCILLVAVQCGEKAATARCARSTAMDSSY